MEIKRKYSRWTTVAMLTCVCALASCHAGYEVTKVEGARVAMDATWDADADPEALALLEPYKTGMDSLMNQVRGVAAVSMDRYRPESPLSNLVADVLREAASSTLRHPADVGLVNIGGIRNVLTQGNITTRTIYEILPFENSLCVLTLKGSDLKALFGNIAKRGGEGVSGVKLIISADGQVLEASVGGKEVEDGRLYTVATVDYLAEGNDGMQALTGAVKKVCPDGVTLRGLFMDYVDRQTKEGKLVTSRVEGRVVVKK